MSIKISNFISHRGVNVDAVENTIEAFQIGKNYGFKWFETDVQMSKDGELFLFHDRTCKRLAGVNLDITEMSIADIKALELVHPILKTKAKIPTLEEYLNWVDENNVLTNLEIKINKDCINYKKNLTNKVLTMLKTHSISKDKVFLSSFSNQVMKFLENDKTYAKGKLFSSEDWGQDFKYLDNNLYSFFVKNNYIAIIINYECLNKERVDYLKRKFGQVFVYSVSSEIAVKNLLSWGVDAMFIDNKEYAKLR